MASRFLPSTQMGMTFVGWTCASTLYAWISGHRARCIRQQEVRAWLWCWGVWPNTHMDIFNITDGRQLDKSIHNYDAVVFVFDRARVERGDIGDTLGQLNTLSDNPENVRRFAGRVFFMFDGYNDDPRQIYQIPEARSFFSKITSLLPLWAHYLHRDPETVGIAYLLLCQSEPFYENSKRVSVSIDTPEANDLTRRLVSAATGLHALHGLTEEESRSIIEDFIKTLPF